MTPVTKTSVRFHVVAGGVSWLADDYEHALVLVRWKGLVYGEARLVCRSRTFSGWVS